MQVGETTYPKAKSGLNVTGLRSREWACWAEGQGRCGGGDELGKVRF